MSDQIVTDPSETQQDDAYDLGRQFVDDALAAVEQGDRKRLVSLLKPHHAADIADLLEQIGPTKRDALLELWGKSFDSEVLSELNEALVPDVIDALPDRIVANAIQDMETDDAVDLIEELDGEQQEKILDSLNAVDRIAIEQSLLYPEDSAGRLMQREVVIAPTHWTIGQAIDHLRADGDLPDRFYDIIVTDPAMKPVGKVQLHALLSRARDMSLVDVMDAEFRTIPVTQSQEDVAYAFNQYNMITAPVVNESGRIVGIITMDDAMEALEEEAEEDMKRLAGLGDENVTDTILSTTKARVPWLAVNLATSILASLVIGMFAGTIEAIVALAVLMPIVASMGGNAGTQTLTVAVRALATRDLTRSNAWRVIRREVAVGLLNGAIFAVVIGFVGYIWFGQAMLGFVLALAMIANMLMAGLAGIGVPILLDWLKLDPALGSSALVTTVTDVVGFFAFLGLASWLLL